MTLFDASGTAAGVGTAAVTARLRASGAAVLAGVAATSFTGSIVDYYSVTASITGDAEMVAAPSLLGQGVAAFHGAAGISFSGQVAHEAEALLQGDSTLNAPIVLTSGTAAGVGTVTGDAFTRAAVGGDAAGAGTVTLGGEQTIHWANAALGGQASFTAVTPVQQIIVGGRVSGVGDVVDAFLAGAAGITVGFGTVTANALRISNASGVTDGFGKLAFSEPLPMIGVGNIVAFAEILTVPPPYCGPICGCERCCGRREEHCNECREWHERRHHQESWWWQCRECWQRHAWHRQNEEHHREWSRNPNPEGLIGSFRWNQTFGKGDLEICIKDRSGNQRGPVFIGYTMFMVTPTGVLYQVGPTDRKPAQADVGKFYVTGTAGENGQPGCWAIRWRYQRTYGEPVYEQLQQFRVADAVLDGDHPDDVRRHCKYGWDL